MVPSGHFAATAEREHEAGGVNPALSLLPGDTCHISTDDFVRPATSVRGSKVQPLARYTVLPAVHCSASRCLLSGDGGSGSPGIFQR